MFLGGIQHEYPFYYRCPFTVLDNGWTAFDTEQEYAKLMIRCQEGWRISSVNAKYRVLFLFLHSCSLLEKLFYPEIPVSLFRILYIHIYTYIYI